MFEGFIWVLV